ncbi:hypothetical protein AB0N87_40040 [Streptomyces sp. NPDC093228]|uniref:hypothetical protein n=1 Tax=Streptomyces sp. NPDC093228 TaxID=3155070 RepID=UPI00341CBD21
MTVDFFDSGQMGWLAQQSALEPAPHRLLLQAAANRIEYQGGLLHQVGRRPQVGLPKW